MTEKDSVAYYMNLLNNDRGLYFATGIDIHCMCIDDNRAYKETWETWWLFTFSGLVVQKEADVGVPSSRTETLFKSILTFWLISFFEIWKSDPLTSLLSVIRQTLSFCLPLQTITTFYLGSYNECGHRALTKNEILMSVYNDSVLKT